MKFKSDIEVQAGLKDSSGAAGTSGQILSSNGTTVSWVNAGESTASDVQNQVKAGVAINKGQAVYVTGADGTNIIVGLASNAAEATSSKTLGLLDATVAINGMANVVQIGRLAGLNTIGANAGDPVWLGTNGNLIYGLVNKPYAPAHLVYIGVVTRVNANNGEIFINVQNGFELDELHNVSARTPSNNNGIFYNTSTSLWEAKSISAAGGIEGSGTTNYVSKFTGASTIGNSLIYDNGTNVGIGTTSPASKLDVDADGYSIIANNSTGNRLIKLGTNASGEPSIQATLSNGTARQLALNPEGGNVGIGTASPSQILESVKSQNADTAIKVTNVDTGGAATAQFFASNGTETTQFFQLGTSYGTSGILTANRGGIYNTSSAGIGIVAAGADGLIAFSTGGTTERMRITSGGNVGIGTTSPSDKLEVNGNLKIYRPNSSEYLQIAVGDVTTNFNGYDSDGYMTYNFNSNGSTRMRIAANGAITATSTITASAGFFNSDMRLKDLTDYDYNVSDIKAISYFWKDGRDNQKHVGYSAQEVQKVMPDAVNESEDGMLSVNYVEVLVAKIAELESRIKQLEK